MADSTQMLSNGLSCGVFVLLKITLPRYQRKPTSFVKIKESFSLPEVKKRFIKIVLYIPLKKLHTGLKLKARRV